MFKVTIGTNIFDVRFSYRDTVLSPLTEKFKEIKPIPGPRGCVMDRFSRRTRCTISAVNEVMDGKDKYTSLVTCYADCDTRDQFSKMTGRKIAFTKALKRLANSHGGDYSKVDLKNHKEYRRIFWKEFFNQSKRTKHIADAMKG